MRRLFPAVGLFFLSPLIAEYLLGDLPITALVALVLLAPLYGGGALLIREVSRRTGRGWPTMLVLAVAYGVLEEGVTTMSLFNPNYAGAHLLDKGFIPQLGIAIPWTVGVLTLHAVWSISLPIALVEELAQAQRTAPWLGPTGWVVTAILFLLGVVGNTAFSVATYHFVASPAQFIAVGVTIIVLVLVALSLGPSVRPAANATRSQAPDPWLIGIVSFVASSFFKSLSWLPGNWPAWLLVFVILGLDLAAVVAVSGWSGRSGWSGAHRIALAAGPLLTYVWSSFPQTPVIPVSPSVDLTGNAVFAAGAVALLVIEIKKVCTQPMTQEIRKQG